MELAVLALNKDRRGRGDTWGEEYWYNAAKPDVWDELMHLPVDEVPIHPRDAIKKWFLTLPWHQVYEVVEFILPNVNRYRGHYDERNTRELVNRLNTVLERELSGYRVVGMQIVPITSPVEIGEIEKAATAVQGFAGVAQHIDAALGLLGKKPDPDYRNCVKESISAVEAAAKLLTGESSGGIDKALAILERAQNLHPSFKLALSKLYGYASDEDGIRHPILEEATVSEPEARFMLVACSAFANLLLSTRLKTT